MSRTPVSSRKPGYSSKMEGMVATWFARNTARQSSAFADDARRIAARLPVGARVLEIAPGPGYLATELARLGAFRVTGLDLSGTFVRMARAHAARAGLAVEFRQGDAAMLPFADDEFDFIVCRAAFKNFGDPIGAIREMHRVLRPGAQALIIDLRGDVTDGELDRAVDEMNLDPVNAFLTRIVFKHGLRRRAYCAADFQAMAAATPFGRAQIDAGLIGFDVWLCKSGG